MSIFNKLHSPVIILTIIACLLCSCGVTSRYRLDLFVSEHDVTKKVDVEQTQFVADAVIGDPFSDNNLVSGQGNVAVLTVGTRWNPKDVSEDFKLMGFDQYWRCRLYIELPAAGRGSRRRSERDIVLSGARPVSDCGRGQNLSGFGRLVHGRFSYLETCVHDH